MNSGTWMRAPVSSTAGLVPPPEAVSPRSPGSVCATVEIGGARELHVGRLVVDVEQLDLRGLLRPLQRVAERADGDRDLLVALRVHEVGVRPVLVEVLHPPGLGAHGPELLTRAEGAVDHRSVAGAAQFRAHERAALARLDVLELEDLEDRPLDVDVRAVAKLIGRDHDRRG